MGDLPVGRSRCSRDAICLHRIPLRADNAPLRGWREVSLGVREALSKEIESYSVVPAQAVINDLLRADVYGFGPATIERRGGALANALAADHLESAYRLDTG